MEHETIIHEATNEVEALASEIYENDTARTLIWEQAVEQAKARMPELTALAREWDRRSIREQNALDTAIPF